MMRRIRCTITVGLCFFAVMLFAQTNPVLVTKQKQPPFLPFTLHSSKVTIDSAQIQVLKRIVLKNLSAIEPFYFYNERRRINIADSDLYIELFSAKEIGEMLKTSVNPEMVRGEQQNHNVILEITADGKLIPKILE